MASLRLPARFAFTILHLSVAGTLACSGNSSRAPADAASADSTVDSALDAPADVTTDMVSADTQPPPSCEGGGAFLCEAYVDGAACPALVCDLSDCSMDAGCLAAA